MSISRSLFNNTLTLQRDEKGRFIKGHIGLCIFHLEKTKQKLRDNHNPKSNLNLTYRILQGHIIATTKKGEHRSPATEIKRGQHISPNTEFKIGEQIGEKSYRWKGGVTALNQLLRHKPEYNAWRQSVYEKDNWLCQGCEKHCGKYNIVAHHIKSFIECPELRFDINNGETLCRSCHLKEHQCQ